MTGLDPSRSVDEETLRYLNRAFGRRPEVHQTPLFLTNKLESLVVTLDVEYYPDHVDGVSLEICAYTNGDFHGSHHKTRADNRRQCRWDRHDQPHNARDHFHPLSDAGTATAVDQNYATDLTRVIEKTMIPWVDGRVGSLWEAPTD